MMKMDYITYSLRLEVNSNDPKYLKRNSLNCVLGALKLGQLYSASLASLNNMDKLYYVNR